MPAETAGARPRRIAIVVNDPAFFLSHRLEIGLEAMARGDEVHLVTPPDPAESVAALRARGFRHHAVEMARGSMSPVRDLATLLRLTRLFRRLRPDLAHLVTLKPVLYGALAARLAGVRAIVAAISGFGLLLLEDAPKMRAVRPLVARLCRFALNRPGVRLVFQNAGDRETLAGFGVAVEGRSVTIPGSGVDLARFSPEAVPEDPPLVVMPARLLHSKGVAQFVASAERLHAERVRARFVHIGRRDPVNPDCLGEAELDELGSRGAIEFWGYRHDVPEILARASVIALPSHYGEGLPKTLIEAAAAGRPVVTTDMPGCRDAIVAGETGLLVPPRDAEALATALSALLADPDRRAAMGEAGRRLAARRYRLADVVHRHLALFDECLARAGR